MTAKLVLLVPRVLRPTLATFFVLFLAAGTTLRGQSTTTANIQGTVKDGTGAIVQSAQITVTDTLTNQSHVEKADSEGVYHVRGLQAGTYVVKAEAPGFRQLVRNGITLDIGQDLSLDLALTVGSATDLITVTAQGSQLETTTGQVSALVDKETLTELPLNGRDLFSLILLQPGVVPTTNSNAQSWSMGSWFKGAVQGTRPSMFNVTSDGSDINDPGFNIPPGGPVGAQLGVDATEEYRVVLNAYNAENGRNGGGQVSYVTKAGTNHFHGSAYEFVRNSALDARNHFDVAVIPHFSRNQFGGSIGGPIVKDKLFFFVNEESLHEIQGITDNSVTIPNANALMGILPAKTGGGTVNVGVNSIAAKYLALYAPLESASTLVDQGNGTTLWSGSGIEQATENFGVIRVDYNPTAKDQFFERSTVDDGHLLSPFGATKVPGFPVAVPNLDSYNQLSWQRIITPKLLNQLKLNFNMTNYISEPAVTISNGAGGILSTSTSPTDPYTAAPSITGVANVGYGNTTPLGSFANNFEIIDNISWDRGHHTFKAGTDLKHIQLAGPFPYGANGTYYFSTAGLQQTSVSNNGNLEAFLLGQPYEYLGAGPQFTSNRFWRQNYTGFFFQDDWRVTPNLTLNLGVRWEYSSNPTEKYGRQGNITNYATATALVDNANSIFAPMPKNLWSPRVGFAYKYGDKTSLRGGFGIMRDQIWENLYADTRFYGPNYQIFQADGISTSTPGYTYVKYLLNPPSEAAIGGIQQNIGSYGVTFYPKFPYYYEFGLNVERQLTNSLLLTVGYAGSHGVHLPRTYEANPIVFTGTVTPTSIGTRINPNFGGVPLVTTDATSAYNGFEFSLKQRVSKGLMFQVSYTWSHNIDTASGPYASDYGSAPGTTEQWFNLEADKGPSDIDRRHVLVSNFAYELPFGRGKSFGANSSSLANAFIGGWQWSGILSLETGPTYSVIDGSGLNTSGVGDSQTEGDRPNLVTPGANQCANTGNPNAWINTSLYALSPQNTYGNAGRNGGCGPALRDFDTNFVKSIRIGEGKVLQLKAEMFNIFNITNYAEPPTTLYTGRVSGCQTGNSCGILSTTAGKITSTVTTSRQIQLAAKFLF